MADIALALSHSSIGRAQQFDVVPGVVSVGVSHDRVTVIMGIPLLGSTVSACSTTKITGTLCSQRA